MKYHYDNVELEIENMTSGLLGTYVCLATNTDGTASLTYIVKYGQGKFLKTFSSIYIVEFMYSQVNICSPL